MERVDDRFFFANVDSMSVLSFLFRVVKQSGVLCLAVWLFVIMSCPLAAAQDTVLHIDYPDYWPFFSRNDDGHMEGFFYDIISEALSRMGIKATWHEYPWGRCQLNVRCGQASAMITVPTKDRLKYTITHRDPFYVKKLTVFTSVDHPKLEVIESLASIEDVLRNDLSVVTYVGNGWNDTYLKSRGVKTYETSQLKNVWRMLANGRGDIAVEWSCAAWPYIIELGVSDKIVQTEVSLASMPFHLLLRKGCCYEGRLEEFNTIILEMKDEGIVDDMVRKYAKVGL